MMVSVRIGRWAGLGLFAALFLGCASTSVAPVSKSGVPFPASKKGDMYLGDSVVLRDVTHATGSKDVKFTVENLSDQDLKDLTATVWFYRKSNDPNVPWESTPEDRVLTIPQHNKRSLVVSSPWKPGEAETWQLVINPQRTKGDPKTGSTFLDGQLRCVKVEDLQLTDHPKMMFTLMNVSSEPVNPPKYMLAFRFHKDSHVFVDTGWRQMESRIEPGKTVMLEFDLKPLIDKAHESLVGLDYSLVLSPFSL